MALIQTLMENIYVALFFSAFIAATLLPAFSELGFAAALMHGGANPALLFIAVSAGNILGALVNWGLGRFLSHHRNKKWFPFSAVSLERAELRFNHYGYWSLLFAWLPVIGDPLTFISGVLRTPFRIFIVLVSIGKMARYAVVWAGISALAG